MDEIDGFPASAGTEGDPRKLAEKRTTNYTDTYIIIQTSTPTIKNLSPIEEEYGRGSMERWHWECPGCGVDVEPLWNASYGRGIQKSPCCVALIAVKILENRNGRDNQGDG